MARHGISTIWFDLNIIMRTRGIEYNMRVYYTYRIIVYMLHFLKSYIGRYTYINMSVYVRQPMILNFIYS